MKKYKLIITWISSLLVIIACHKSSVQSSPAAFNIINAIPTSNFVIPVLGTYDTISDFYNVPTIGYPGSEEYSLPEGMDSIYMVQGTDTTRFDIAKVPLFRATFNLASGAIYSFFLAGDTTSVDTLLVEDHIPYYGDDSSAGVRFVNLSTGSMPMSITLSGNPVTQTEFSNLGYKAISSFKSYIAKSNVENSSYSFIVRDQMTGDSLTSFTWNYSVFKSNTLIISGSKSPSSASPIQVFQMNNF